MGLTEFDRFWSTLGVEPRQYISVHKYMSTQYNSIYILKLNRCKGIYCTELYQEVLKSRKRLIDSSIEKPGAFIAKQVMMMAEKCFIKRISTLELDLCVDDYGKVWLLNVNGMSFDDSSNSIRSIDIVESESAIASLDSVKQYMHFLRKSVITPNDLKSKRWTDNLINIKSLCHEYTSQRYLFLSQYISPNMRVIMTPSPSSNHLIFDNSKSHSSFKVKTLHKVASSNQKTRHIQCEGSFCHIGSLKGPLRRIDSKYECVANRYEAVGLLLRKKPSKWNDASIPDTIVVCANCYEVYMALSRSQK